jgi:hypothetical protein
MRIRIHNNCRSYLINLLGILVLLAGVKVVGEPVERLEVMEEMEGDILEAGEGEVDEPRHAEPLLVQAVLHLLHQRLHHLQQCCAYGIQLDYENL